MSNYYMVPEDELVSIISDSLMLRALIEGDVDHWDYFDDAINEYLTKAFEDEYYGLGWDGNKDFGDLARGWLFHYRKVDEN